MAQGRRNTRCRQRTAAIHPQLPGPRCIQPGQQPQQRGLARATGADQRVTFAPLQGQIHPGQRTAGRLRIVRIQRRTLEHHALQRKLLPVGGQMRCTRFLHLCMGRNASLRHIGPRRSPLGQRQRANLVTARVIDLLARERLEMCRHTGNHAARLQRIFVHHEQVADAYPFHGLRRGLTHCACRLGAGTCGTGHGTGSPRDLPGRPCSPLRRCIGSRLHLRPGRHHALHRQPHIQRQQHDPQHAVEQIHRGPLALVVDDGPPDRREHRIQPCVDELQHPTLQPQCQYRQHVDQPVREAGPVFAVGRILLARQPHHDLVERHDDGRQQQIAHHGHPAHPGRDEPQRHHRPHQPHHALQIDELALRKVVERARGLLHPVRRLHAMLGLVPGQRCGIQPLHQVGGHALAHHQRHVAFQNAPRPVHQPAGQRGQKHQQQHLPGLRKAIDALCLQRVDGRTRQRRHGQLEALRADQQDHGPHQCAAPPGGKAPEFTVQEADAERGVGGR